MGYLIPPIELDYPYPNLFNFSILYDFCVSNSRIGLSSALATIVFDYDLLVFIC